MVGWLVGLMVGGGVIGWLVRWLVRWSVGWLVGPLVGCSVGWLVGYSNIHPVFPNQQAIPTVDRGLLFYGRLRFRCAQALIFFCFVCTASMLPFPST